MYPWVSHQTKPSRSQAIDALKEMERSWDIAGFAPFDMQCGLPALPPDRRMHELHLKQLDKYKRYMGRHPQCLPLDVLNKRCLLPQLILEHCKLLGSEHNGAIPLHIFLLQKSQKCSLLGQTYSTVGFYDLLCRLGDLGCLEFAVSPLPREAWEPAPGSRTRGIAEDFGAGWRRRYCSEPHRWTTESRCRLCFLPMILQWNGSGEQGHTFQLISLSATPSPCSKMILSTPPAAPPFFAWLATGSAFSLTPIWQPCGRFGPQADQGEFPKRFTPQWSLISFWFFSTWDFICKSDIFHLKRALKDTLMSSCSFVRTWKWT